MQIPSKIRGQWRPAAKTFALAAPLLCGACTLRTSAWAADTKAPAPAAVATGTFPASPETGTDPAALLRRLDAVAGRLDNVAKKQEAELKPLSLALPSLTFDVPSAYGASAGDFGIGLGYQDRQRYGHHADAVEGVVFGLGDGAKVGLEIEAVNRDTSRPFKNTSVGFKLHHNLPRDTSIALGVENLVINGKSDSDTSTYVTATRKFKLRPSSRAAFSRLFMTAGIGNGRFRSERDVAFNKKVINGFGCVAITVGPPAMVFAEWTGQDLNLGISLAPFPSKQFVITPAISDVTRSAGDGHRFTLGISYIPGK